MPFHFIPLYSKFSRSPRRMLRRSWFTSINYMRLHNRKTAKQYSAEYGKTWTKEIIPRTDQDVQLYGWLHNYPYHNLNDLAWWANRRRPRHTLANYALQASACSKFGGLLRQHETTAIHELSIGGRTTLLLPTDSGFDSLHQATLDSLLSDPNQGRDLLFNHIVRGELSVRNIVQRCRQTRSKTATFKTLGGRTLTAKVLGSLESGDRQILVSTSSSNRAPAKVINHGIKCSNGVVFVLDGIVD